MAGWDWELTDKGIAIVQPKGGGHQRVAVLIPHRNAYDWREWWMWFVGNMKKPVETATFHARGFSLCTNREFLVAKALEIPEITHMFFLDDDTIPPDNVIEGLLAMKTPLAAGLYRSKKRKGEGGLAAWMYSMEHRGYMPINLQQKTRYVTVDVTGLGCCLIERQVFEKLRKPWFRWDPPPGVSEDFYFFEECAAQLRYKPVIDMEMRCKHIGEVSLDVEGNWDMPTV